MIRASKKGNVIFGGIIGNKKVVFAEFLSICRNMSKDFSEEELVQGIRVAGSMPDGRKVDWTGVVEEILCKTKENFKTAAEMEPEDE